MTREELQDVMEVVFDECRALRQAGQKEYAHDEGNAFANFERVAQDLGLDRKQILWIFAMKHRDGIAGYIKGHVSQREDVRGRINDLIVYLIILRGMIDERRPEAQRAVGINPGHGAPYGTGSIADRRVPRQFQETWPSPAEPVCEVTYNPSPFLNPAVNNGSPPPTHDGE